MEGPYSLEYLESQGANASNTTQTSSNSSWYNVTSDILGLVGIAAATAPAVAGGVQAFQDPQQFNAQQIAAMQAKAQIENESKKNQMILFGILAFAGICILGLIIFLTKK